MMSGGQVKTMSESLNYISPWPPLPRQRSAGTLELRELRYFQSVARTGNFGRAARELNIGQPNVSHQIRKLEEELGTRLVIRHRQGVTLTPAGSALMDRVDAIMKLLNTPLEQVPAPESTIGTVTVALPPECAPLLAPVLYQSARTRWPNLAIVIREGTSASLVEWVLDRQVDHALLQNPPALRDLDIEPVVSERLGLVSGARPAAMANVQDSTGPVRVRELAGVSLILPSQRHWTRRMAETAAFQRGIVLDQVLRADHVSLVKEMVRGGLGSSILPYSAVRDEVTRGTLVFRPIEHYPMIALHAIASPAPITEFTREFRAFLRGVIAVQVAREAWAGAAMVAVPSRLAAMVDHPELEAAIE